MNLAQNLDNCKYCPLDYIENIFADKFLGCERRSNHELVLEVNGKWNNILLFLAWEESMNCLHLSCLLPVENNSEDKSKIFELLALVNADLWVGHFSYWSEHKMPIFKHSVLINDFDMSLEKKVSQLMDIAVKECERLYPVFNVVLNKGMNPQDALYPFNMQTIGQA
ncbi:MAG: YbjN domain-containing protein [Alphaproteobacteria bacterium]